MKEAFLMFLVFVAGGVAFLNLSFIKYGVPEHYDGGWAQVSFACFLAICFGVMVLKSN